MSISFKTGKNDSAFYCMCLNFLVRFPVCSLHVLLRPARIMDPTKLDIFL